MRVLSLLSVLLLVAAGCDSNSEPGPPVTAQIVKVVILDAPLADPDGAGWDGGTPDSNGPDLYFRLFDDRVSYQGSPGDDRLNPRDDDNVVPFRSGDAWYNDVQGGDFPLTWDVEPGYEVRNLDDPLYIALYDHDPSNTDDPMAYSDTFRLRGVAPGTVTGRTQTLALDGFDRNDDAIADFEVRITFEFFD